MNEVIKAYVEPTPWQEAVGLLKQAVAKAHKLEPVEACEFWALFDLVRMQRDD